MDQIGLALELTGLGLGIVFAVLLLFYASISLLNKFFPDKPELDD